MCVMLLLSISQVPGGSRKAFTLFRICLPNAVDALATLDAVAAFLGTSTPGGQAYVE